MTSRFKNSLPVRLLVNVIASPADLQIAMISTTLSLCSGVNLSKPSIKLNVTLGIPVSCVYEILDLGNFTLVSIDFNLAQKIIGGFQVLRYLCLIGPAHYTAPFRNSRKMLIRIRYSDYCIVCLLP